MANCDACPHFAINDQYYTTKAAWEQISDLIPNDKVIWEAFQLNSIKSKSMANLIELGKNVVGDTNWDFFDKCDTLDFDMKINLYGPIKETGIITKSIADIYEIQRGLADSDTQIERITTVTNPRNVSADSDFGFTEYIDLTDPFTDSA